MKPLILTALALGLGAGQTLTTDYTRDRSLTVTVRSSSGTETTANEVTIDGEPMERGGGGGGGNNTSERSYSYTDSVLKSKDGAPTKVKRVFGEVGGSTVMSFGDQERESALESAFSGAIVVIDATGDEQKVEVLEGDLEDEQTAALVPTISLDRLLPDGEVEAGASWELSGDDFLAALCNNLERQLFRRPAAPQGGDGQRGQRGGAGGGMGGRGIGLATLAGGEWDSKATLTEETEEVDGVECVVIELKAEVSGELPEQAAGRGRGRDRAFGLEATPRANTYEAELKGRLLWSVGEARAVRLELTGTIETVIDMERDTQRGAMKMHSEQETKFEMTVDVTAGAKGE